MLILSVTIGILFSLLVVGILILNNRVNRLLVSFVSDVAKKFLLRNLSYRNSWAASAGFQTAQFSIDHDPDKFFTKRLPSTLLQIRDREILNSISNILGSKQSYHDEIGSQIHGVINPEFSNKPCIDVLCLFSCLHLDAVPLIERRFKRLSSLFPILNPSLIQMFKLYDIDNTMSQNLWLFGVDYNWVDENIVHNNNRTNYKVSMSALDQNLKVQIYEYLRSRNQLGNFIWISETARSKLIQEASILANIIQAYPMPSTNKHQNNLIFLIKFEDLIPRLQKHYNLDVIRLALKDFEIRSSTYKTLTMLELQISQAKSPKTLFALMKDMLHVDWKGFKEKDFALQMVLKVYAKLNELNRNSELTPKSHRHFTNLITKIGYPSQIIFTAQQDKLTLRNTDIVLKLALKPNHKKFVHTWLFLSTGDLHRYSKDDIKKFISMIYSIPNKLILQKHLSFVIPKAMDTILNIYRAIPEIDSEIVYNVFNLYANWLVHLKVDAELFNYFLDTFTHVQKHYNEDLTLAPNTHNKLNQYFQILESKDKDAAHLIKRLEATNLPPKAA